MNPAPGFVITTWMYWPAAILAALGLVTLFVALLRDRARGRKRCPGCWYDLAGVAGFPARCPECGRVAATQRELARTRRRWGLAALGLLLLFPLPALVMRRQGRAIYYAVMPKWKLTEETRSGGTTISLFTVRDPLERGGRVVVKSNGRTVLDHEDSVVSTSGYKHERPTLLDLNGDGVDECVIECYSGGAHCCFRAYVLELRPGGVHLAADIDAQNGLAVVPPTGGTGEWLLNIPDQSFVYWKAPYVASPRPPVSYRLHDGALRIAVDAMQGTLDSAAAGELARTTLPTGGGAGPDVLDPALWGGMLTLIYSGHEPLAWAFFDRNWRGSAEQKGAFRKEFLGVLAADSWYQDFTAARAALEAGKPIPPSIVGMSGANTK